MRNAKIKLEHAKKLLIQFANEYKKFITANYQLIKEDDKTTGGLSIRVRVKKNIPDDWSTTIGDIIHNTRSSLDLLVTDLLIANGKEPTNKSAFPIFETEREFQKSAPTKVDGIQKEACALIEEIKPYKEGNLQLWQLHQLDIVDKHRIIIPVVNENKAVVIDFGAHMKQLFGDKVGNVPSMPIGIRPAEREIHDGMVLFTGDKTHTVPTFDFELVFGKGDLLAGEPISESLNGFLSLVESIINKFESL